MKKILLLAITIFSINNVFSQSQRMVLVEEFTQASCPPCETTTPALNALMGANLEKVVQLRYQTSWPGVDPMNADNPGEVQARVDYYNVQGVPNLWFDGGIEGVPGSQVGLNQAYALTAPVAMEVSHQLSADLTTITATVTITNEGTEAYNVSSNRLRVVVVEEEINWRYRPGSTSLVDFEAVMKTFLTGTVGMEIPEIAAGESWTMSWEDVALNSTYYNYDKVAVVGFIQNDDTRSIAQSGMSETAKVTGFANLDIEDITIIPSSLCETDIIPTMRVTNTGDVAMDNYTVGFAFQGTIVESKDSEEALEGGASIDISFEGITLPSGSSQYLFISQTEQQEVAILDNQTTVARLGRIGPVVDTYKRDFESDAPSDSAPAPGVIVVAPFSLYNFTVVDAATIGGSSPVGAYGESAKSISVNFWNWNNGSIDANGYMIIADQYLAPENLQLRFDYAYTSYQNSTDRLIVEVSTDCGATFDELFNKAGTNLATAPEVNNNEQRFIPSSESDWETLEADLSSYAGETLIVRFRVVSSWGDMLYLDNIELRAATDINELEANESLRVFPNPAQSYVNVELNTPNATNVQLKVIDMLGRTVKSENLGNLSGQLNHKLDISSVPNGSYLVLINVDGRDVVKRISVAH